MLENIKKIMAKISLSNNESIDVSNDTARQINQEWNEWLLDKKNNPSSVTINNQNILMNRIRGVRFDAPQEIYRYDLSNKEHKGIIRDFEKELGELTIKEYLIKKDAWVVNSKYPEGAVRDPNLYNELTKKHSSLQELRFLRERAKKHEIRELEEMASQQDTNSELEVVSEATELTQLDETPPTQPIEPSELFKDDKEKKDVKSN